ncbi:MAG: hypothetical protein D6768_04435 [Chloroflexi bacterium]|nr:MAG: hypothetical protein D6768_04435 [Chloroflexota bacterium]
MPDSLQNYPGAYFIFWADLPVSRKFIAEAAENARIFIFFLCELCVFCGKIKFPLKIETHPVPRLKL